MCDEFVWTQAPQLSLIPHSDNFQRRSSNEQPSEEPYSNSNDAKKYPPDHHSLGEPAAFQYQTCTRTQGRFEGCLGALIVLEIPLAD